MAVINYIDGIPTFSTKLEAMAWGLENYNIRSIHIHYIKNKVTYMAGNSHDHIKGLGSQVQARQFQPVVTVTPPPPPPPTEQLPPTPQQLPGATGGTGGGGGGGY